MKTLEKHLVVLKNSDHYTQIRIGQTMLLETLKEREEEIRTRVRPFKGWFDFVNTAEADLLAALKATNLDYLYEHTRRGIAMGAYEARNLKTQQLKQALNE